MKKTIECPICNVIFITSDKSRKCCSWECRNKRISQNYKGKTFTEEHKNNISKNHHNVLGENNPNWKGGVTSWDRLLRSRKIFKIWKRQVLEKNNFCCVNCNESDISKLDADHILPLFIFPELAFEVNNGQTLCKSCHIKKTQVDKKKYFIKENKNE